MEFMNITTWGHHGYIKHEIVENMLSLSILQLNKMQILHQTAGQSKLFCIEENKPIMLHYIPDIYPANELNLSHRGMKLSPNY